MKKLLNILSISILITVLCSTTTSNAKTTNDDIDLLLIPYNKIMTYVLILQKSGVPV